MIQKKIYGQFYNKKQNFPINFNEIHDMKIYYVEVIMFIFSFTN